MKNSRILAIITGFIFSCSLISFSQSGNVLKIFQFPADRIPRIDGNSDDWDIVPAGYEIGSYLLRDDEKKHSAPDPANLDVKVKVGWVKGMNKLYFLYEAYDNYWDFSKVGLHHDIFEIVVDADQSGGPLIEQFHPNPDLNNTWEAYFNFHGVHAQNYHIFTPAEGEDWCLAWGSQPWIKELPYANAAYKYDFRPGESGKLVLEFWITPFDYAGPEGPVRAVESVLEEGRDIGLCWAVIDFDDVNARSNNGFWNLSEHHTMYGNASQLRTFRLMPLEQQFRKKIDAQWSFRIIDMDRRMVAFRDQSAGQINSWKWDFGDGTTSSDQHPVHTYTKPGRYIVILYIEGPDGKSIMGKMWDVAVRSGRLDRDVKSN